MDVYKLIAENLKTVFAEDRDPEKVKAHKELYYDCLHKAPDIPILFISKAALKLILNKQNACKDHMFGRKKVYGHGTDMTIEDRDVELVASFFKKANCIIYVTPEENDALRKFQRLDQPWITYEKYISVTGQLYKRVGRYWKNSVPDVNEEARVLFDISAYLL
jgi:hypothetical protein